MTYDVVYAGGAEHLPPPQEEGRSTASKVVHQAGDVRAVNIALAEGAALSEHATAHPIYVHVLSGEIEVTCEGRTDSLGAGGLVFVDRNVPHAVVAVRPSSILVTFLP
ncbi:hypothetical protein AU195_00950 [Mycobacterium sp. IS-1496]|uniref:cupin domain-containing protein n=1 Tax=Mycobacterium sp. IS-1496 TaxID=1772284 RepID=UPI0007417B72|nr:cupin domain-containing protein [Mycobacterium sp. IS-1496]KUI30314.1 hypothetical protein AU195_00950 [Mycobacterium sp. IS-1496]